MTGPSGAGPAATAPPDAAAAATAPASSSSPNDQDQGQTQNQSQNQNQHHITRPTSDSSRQSPIPTASAFSELGLTNIQQHNAADPSIQLLAFSDLPSDLVQLKPIPADNYAITADSINNSSTIKAKNHQPRKPSPGLAARLKALGFGTQRQSSPSALTPNHEHVGRLPEDQLRFLDRKHQANSTETVIERRGRPWKGAGAPLQLLRSKSSRDSFRRKSAASEDEKPSPPLSVQAESTSKPELLPEITEAPPLDMDTNKYRLPDHTNGNGTKAQLDTRREHLERDIPIPTLEVEDPQTPPPVPAKDTPPGGTASAEFTSDLPSYFNPLGLQRPGSIYTISRASFANQLAQLTALQLPDAELLSSKVAAIPTAQAANKALLGAAEQIRSWISKASEVIGGLDSDDDVEWAAAGGREGYEEVENAITRFEGLINVYVTAIEELQNRRDIANVSSDDLQKAVTQMEAIMSEWSKIRSTLNNVKGQVETAMEWEELWNMVLGDIQNEMDELSRLIFEMEERRHKSIMAVSNGDGVDIGDLETIVEETPPAVMRNNRYSVPSFPLSPSSPGTPTLTQDDSSLLALFARMQPLRASLDFLPMRLSVFEARASGAFPTACEELEMRREGLEASYVKLEKDAESLRKELGEDKWVLVFRGAGRQAQKMIESVDRSMGKLRESVDQGLQLSSPAAMSKKIESYEAKKMHYGPAIERVLSIIDKGVKDRLTVNGEVLRLHNELQSKWAEVRESMATMSVVLDEIQSYKQNQQLRDSISSMLSIDRSTVASGNDTPGSSPPSSVVMSSLGLDPITPSSKNKRRATSGGSHLPQPSTARRSSSSLAPPPSRRPLGSRYSTYQPSTSSLMTTPPRSGSATPMATRLPRSTSNVADNRPRWNASTNTNDSDVGHNFKPLSLTTPSPYARKTPTSSSSITPTSGVSKLPLRSPLGRATSSSPIPEDTPPRKSTSRLSFRDRIHAAASGQSPAKPRFVTQLSNSSFDSRRSSLQPPRPGSSINGNFGDLRQRPASSLATTNRRSSLLPQPKSRADDETGRHSPHATAAARAAMRKGNSMTESKQPRDNKPRWHF
ncbi:KAR9-domain-containing protein [Annulohypoxylon maeteangense]|uniref:KAR9-domain-containing protein n=1 Tax=Annulohypoxylon maeteangense TaxID=1927788 RepID=UPI0020079A45|nr:KAR9-domain-containing protein [Annulohypoxylon maeteangense]KAI0890481.1 KAR9-domain-containing protein [Annulohypoxylon maeteangense]